MPILHLSVGDFTGASGASGSTGPSGSNGATGGHFPSLLPSTLSRLSFTNCMRCVCLQVCPARVAVQAPQVGIENMPCACHAASCLTRAGTKQLVTLQARPAQMAAQAPQVGTDNMPCARHAASCLTRAGSKQLVTLQARPAQMAAQDLLAPMVQLAGTFQVGYQVPSSTQSLTKLSCWQACPARVAVQAPQVCTAELATSLPCSLMPNLRPTHLVVVQARPA